MAEVDSLEIKIESTIKGVNKDLDNLIKRLGIVSDGLSAIQSNKGLDEFSKKAKLMSAEIKSVFNNANKIPQNISSSMKKASKPMDDMKKSAKEMAKDFSDKFKNIEVKVDFSKPEAELKKFQSQAENAQNALARILASSTANKQASGIERWTASLSQANNAIQQLEKHMEEIKDANKNIQINIDFGDSDQTLESFKEQLKQFDLIIESGGEETEAGITFPVRGLEITLEQLREMYPEAKELIESYEEEIERAKSLSSNATFQSYENIDLSVFESAKEKINETSSGLKDLGNLLNQLEIPEIREDNLDKLYSSLNKTEAKLEELRINLKNGLTMGRITESVDDSGFVKLQEQIALTEKNAEALKQKISEVEEQSGTSKFQGLKKVLQSVASLFSRVVPLIKGFGSGIKNAISNISKFKNGISSLVRSNNKMNASFSGGLKTILKYGLGIRSLYILMNKIRSAFTDGANNLVQYSSEFNKSISSVTSALKTLKNAFAVAFSPIINAVAPYITSFINMMVKALNVVGQFFSALTGKSYAVQTKDIYEDYADSISDATDETKKLKKANDNLQGFDIINKLSDNTDTSEKDLKDTGTAISDMFKTVKIKSDIADYAKKIKKALLDAWKKGDFTEIGEKAADWINKGLANIPWEKIKKTSNKIAKSIATFLNGFIKRLKWEKVGENIAEGLNTAIGVAYTFWTTFDWLTFGKKLATMLNSALKKFDAKMLGKTLGAKLRGMIQFAFGIVTTFNFNQLGAKIADSINGFFEEMGEVRPNTGLTGWQELGKSISKSITGILDTINTALESIKWEEVGKAIADFLGSIDWLGILTRTAKVIVNALWSAIKTLFSTFASDPIGVGSAFVTVFGAIFAKKALFDKLLPALKTSFGNLFTNSISGAKINTTGMQGKFSSLGTKLGKIIGKSMAAIISIEIAGSVVDAVYKASGSDSKKTTENLKKIYGEEIGGFAAGLLSTISGVTGGNYKSTYGWNSEASGDIKTDTKKLDAYTSGADKTSKVLKKLRDNLDKTGASYTSQLQILELAKKELDNGTISVNQLNKIIKKGYSNLSELREEIGEKGIGYTERFINQWKKLKKTMSSANMSDAFSDKIFVTLSTALDNGTISWKSYKKIVDGTYTSKKQLNKAVNNAMINTKEYKNNVNKLKITMTNLGVKEKEQKEILGKLKNALKTGKISWEDNKKIMDGNYKSAKELRNAINNLSSKTVKVKADVSGEKDVSDLKGEVGTLSGKNIFISATTNGIKSIEELKTAMGTLKNKTISATISPELRKNWASETAKKIKEDWAKIKTPNIEVNVNAVSKSINTESGKKVSEKVASKYKELYNKANKTGGLRFESGVLQVPEKALTTNETTKKQKANASAYKKLLAYCRKYGILASGYANGGFPAKGQLFLANEAGAELVGSMNGKTTVANQDEIATGFATAITKTLAPVMYAAFKQAATETAQQSGGDVYLDGKKITESVISHVNTISKSKGKSPIWGIT